MCGVLETLGLARRRPRLAQRYGSQRNTQTSGDKRKAFGLPAITKGDGNCECVGVSTNWDRARCTDEFNEQVVDAELVEYQGEQC
jgi:hypothetical protein